MLVLFALGLTLAAVLASAGAAAVVSGLRDEAEARRRARVRAAELANLAAAAQRWRLTPAALGGPAEDRFADVSFGALGLTTRLFRPSERRTESGVYRLVPVPACAAVDAAAARAGLEAGRDALVVVGYDPVSGDDAAVIVLDALVQVPLARVPWAWIAELSRPAEPVSEAELVAAPEPAPEVVDAAPAPTMRAVRLPTRRAIAADRPEAPRPTPLRLVGWPPAPVRPPPEADPPPVRRARWRRAA